MESFSNRPTRASTLVLLFFFFSILSLLFPRPMLRAFALKTPPSPCFGPSLIQSNSTSLADSFLADLITLTSRWPNHAIYFCRQEIESAPHLARTDHALRTSFLQAFSTDLAYYDGQHFHLRQLQKTLPLPIRTAALLGTPSKTLHSGTPELVRGLRQFVLLSALA